MIFLWVAECFGVAAEAEIEAKPGPRPPQLVTRRRTTGTMPAALAGGGSHQVFYGLLWRLGPWCSRHRSDADRGNISMRCPSGSAMNTVLRGVRPDVSTPILESSATISSRSAATESAMWFISSPP